MGYSERYCHLCGVSFNLSRIRTATEPRSYAWRQRRDNAASYPSYVGAHDSADCGRTAGCMLVYRKDGAERLRRQQRQWAQHNGLQSTGDGNHQEDDNDNKNQDDCDGDDDNDEDFVPDEMVMNKLRIDDGFKETHDPSTLERFAELIRNALGNHASNFDHETGSLQQASSNDTAVPDDLPPDVAMDYDYESPPETCSEYSFTPEEQATDTSSTDQDEVNYRQFVSNLTHRNTVDQAVAAEENVVLPLYRVLRSGDRDSISTIGSDASFECDATKDSDEWHTEKSDYQANRRFSHYRHPLSKGLDRFDREGLWEHIAGPGCVNKEGYNGFKISEEEMRFANTLQCLVHKDDAGREGYGDEVPREPHWESESDDELWESTSAWFLSGISDHMPSRDMDDPKTFPQRHGREYVNAENVCWGPDINDDHPRYAMPFHPACFEIYKRAAVKKHGDLHVDLLGSWWKLKSRYHEFHSFPRADPVYHGAEQSWHHHSGAEYLAADPLFPAALRDAIRSATASNANALILTTPTRFDGLPAEIKAQIMACLDAVDAAKASLAIPSLLSTAEPMIRKDLEERQLYLWELESPQTYYKWTGITACELQTMQRDFDEREKDIQSVLEILQQEGYDEMHDQLKQYRGEDTKTRRDTAFSTVIKEKSAFQIPNDEVGIARFVIALEEALAKDNIKGLQNRARIWRDCETILDQIEELQRKGDILPNGQVRPGASLYEHDQ